METESSLARRVIPKKYMEISYKMRVELIKLVEQDKLSILQSCKKLGIRKSTAKSILRNYRKTGKIFRRKSEESPDQQIDLTPQKPEQVSTPTLRIPDTQINFSNFAIPTSIMDNDPAVASFWTTPQFNPNYFQLPTFYPNCYYYLM